MLFVCFGTPNFSIAREAYRRACQKFGQESLVFHIDSDPLKAARADNPEIFSNQRGYGYWFWKPYIIEEAFKRTEPGTQIFYTDIGVRLESSPKKLLDLIKDWDFATFRVGPGTSQRAYTKRDCFVLMNADEPAYWEDEQSNGAFWVIRNCEAGRKFVAEWKEFMRDPRILTDIVNTQGLPNLHGFVDHRHDQSITSVLATRYKFPMLRDPSQWGNADKARNMPPYPKVSERFDPYDFGQVFFHHRQRDDQLR